MSTSHTVTLPHVTIVGKFDAPSSLLIVCPYKFLLLKLYKYRSRNQISTCDDETAKFKGNRTPVKFDVFKSNVRVAGTAFFQVLKKATKDNASDEDLQALVDHRMWHFYYM
jgi:hypothetical protein